MVEDFPGEGIRNGSVIVIKTHSPPDRFPVDQAILLVRNPYRALLSEANRIAATQTGHVNPELFTTEGNIDRCTLLHYLLCPTTTF